MSSITNLAAIREKLAASTSREYWQSLDELAETEEFQDYIKHEFPRDVDLWMEPISRRTFLKLMGASMAMAFFTGCRRPLETIIPYNQAPEDLVAGKPLYFASALALQGYARGVLVESQMGRPTKIEGNPLHPDSLGATDAFMQAEILSLYDPDRSQVVVNEGAIRTWDDFLSVLQSKMAALAGKQGTGLRILTETVTSPTLGDQLAQILRKFPGARWHQYEPASRDNVRAGSQLAFGRMVETQYRLAEADVIVSLDANFLSGMPGSLRYARDFAARRRVEETSSSMNRLYVVEPTPSITGGMADHRLPLRAADIPAFAQRLADAVGVSAASGGALSGKLQKWLDAAAQDLRRHRGRSLVMAGDSQPPQVHALAHAMNHALGNIGHTVVYTNSAEAQPVDQLSSLKELAKDMSAGQVELLLILGGNPVFTAPQDIGFAEAMSQVGFCARLGLYQDETSDRSHWHIPEAHALEAWSDLRAYDGTVSLIQPLIEPLYGGKTAHEVLSAVLSGSPQSSHTIVHDYWQHRSHAIDFESAWRKSLHDGIVAGTAFDPLSVSLTNAAITLPAFSDAIEIVFQTDPSLWDGRYANNGWLQELPKPLTSLTWDNAAYVAPALAERLGLGNEEVIDIEWNGRAVQAPVWILPGQADRSITVTLGYGRTGAGRVGNGAGFNAYAIRHSDSLWSGQGIKIRKTGKTHPLAATQHHYAMEGRDLIRVATLPEYERNPDFAQEKTKAPTKEESLYNFNLPKVSDEYAWGMAIDLNSCTGCNACVVACQAENNIPIVGKEEVSRGREMHWIRVSRYFKGDLDNPEIYNQPVPCMHCEDAPCEVVCPVGATTHSDEGLNQMVYNRCIGTRYCSNNCPYKVRRFNFFNYTKDVTGPLKLLQNPDVTVRSRGVMEKCTYCVQRINSAKIQAEEEGRTVRDGDLVPACAQSCPSQSIVFGNLLDKKSKVSKMKAEPRDYALLADLGTRPRTTYGARLRNPNPDLEGWL